jgi:alpha-N-acetylglucosaminidase
MFSGYYLPRWQQFFARLDRSLADGTAWDRGPFAAASCEWEKQWSARHERYRAVPVGDAVAVARTMAARWRAR